MTSLLAIVSILLPHSIYLWHLYLCSFVIGLGYGVYFNSNNVWLLELFADNSGPILQLSGFVYGAGTILGPLLFQSYVTGETIVLNTGSTGAELIIIENINKTFINDYSLDVSLNSSQSFVVDINTSVNNDLRRSKLKIPFLICGLIVLIGN